MRIIRVAVIGAGAAGLCALRHLAAKPALYDPVGFEQMTGVGGTWIYTDQIGKDENGIPIQSSMYKNLKTNLPKEVMAFPGFPFPKDLPSFIKHDDVLKYLEDYCDHYDIRKFINFGTKVDKVEPLAPGSDAKWRIQYCTVGDRAAVSSCQLFDAVMVCNGHYAVPLEPDIPGKDQFKGTIMHSHNYRIPKPFKGQVVVCLGAASSGQDICLDIATVAKEVILSHNKPPLQTPFPENTSQQPGIKRITPETVIFKNGVEKRVNVLMLCTGYKYDFPFLSEECAFQINDERVTPLYKHLIHANYPTLAVIGVCKVICPFPQFENQVRFFLTTLEETFVLPSTKEMEEDIKKDFEARLEQGLPARHAHHMGPRQWEYNDMLSDMGQFEPIQTVVMNLYEEVHIERGKNLPNYKKFNYRITGAETFKVIEP